MIDKPTIRRLRGNTLASAVAIVALGASTCSLAAKPNCSHMAANISIQLELHAGSRPTYHDHSVAAAKSVVEGAYGKGRSDLEKTLPGVYDWAVLTVVRSWERGITVTQSSDYVYLACAARFFD